jgi:LytS/YehU family sensor histidine kinase
VTLKKFLGTITAVIILSTLAGVGISYLILSNKQAQVNNTKLHISSESNMAIVDENTPINVPDNSENLTQPYPEPATEKGHTTGIGVHNVINRLRLYYNQNDAFDIKCEDGLTKMIFKLSRNRKQGENNV